jgi:hypothetical protein
MSVQPEHDTLVLPWPPRLSLVPPFVERPLPWYHPKTRSGRRLQLAVRWVVGMTAAYAAVLAAAFVVAWTSLVFVPA